MNMFVKQIGNIKDSGEQIGYQLHYKNDFICFLTQQGIFNSYIVFTNTSMKRIKAFSITLILLGLPLLVTAQSSVQISTPELEMRNDQILISYEILNSTSNDRFNIWIEVTDDNGRTLSARALRGDYGENVRGGGMKQISWDYQQDVVSLDAGIYVQVFGERMSRPGQEQQTNVQRPAGNSTPSVQHNSVNKTGTLWRSVVLPGWGLTAMNPGKPHWLKGVVGYAAIASSVAFNKMAASSYDLYLESTDQNEIDTYFNQAKSQNTISMVSIYVAAGIWVTDIVWTLVSNPGGYQSQMQKKGMKIGTGYDPVAQAPMVGLRYTF